MHTIREETLDPESWDELRQLGHRMVDDSVDSLATVRDRPPWQPVPEEVRERLRRPLPLAGEPAEDVYRDFQRDVQPYPYGNIHPRFWGWVNGSGEPLGVFADFLASAMNSNVGAFEQSASYVEEQAVAWLAEMLGFPSTTSGLLLSGGSLANLLGLAVGRNAKAPFDIRRQGLNGGPRLTLYGSVETHSSVIKAVEMLGLGTDALRLIPVDGDFRVDIAALKAKIEEDLAAGHHPFCVVGNAGTVNTGGSDDLASLADLCDRHDLWLHVDGAFGALAWLADEARPQLAGMQRADSLAFDPHKWLYLPLGVGCLLVRDEQSHRGAFTLDPTPAYLTPLAGGLMTKDKPFAGAGIELSRRFRALKVWMSLKHHGVDKLGRMIGQNIAQATYLAEQIAARPELELTAPVHLNIVCFRFRAPHTQTATLDAINRELLVRLQESGAAVPSHTFFGGRFSLRVAITNHRSRRSDFEFLAAEVSRLGNDLLSEVRRRGVPPEWKWQPKKRTV